MSSNSCEAAACGSAGSQEPCNTSINPRHERNRELRCELTEVSERLIAAQERGAEVEISRLARQLDRVKAEIYLANKGLVSSAVRRFRRQDGNDSSDYYSAAIEGFFKALAKWDPAEGTLGTFARSYIEGELRRAVHASEVTGISYGDWTARAKVKKAATDLERKLGRRPSDAEISAAAGVTATLVNRVRMAQPTSLSTPIGDGDMTLADLVTEQSGEDASLLGELLASADLRTLTAGLSRRETWVLVRREGFDSAPPQTLVEISAETGLGREVLRRAENRAREHVMTRLGLHDGALAL